MSTPTQRTLEACRERGWVAGVTEYWQPSFAQRAVVDAAVDLHAKRNGEASRALDDAVCKLQKVGPGKRQDLFDFVDILAIGDCTFHAIQTTTTSGQGARYIKIVGECEAAAKAWLDAGGRIWVVGWKKYKQAVDRKFWRATWREITMADFRPKVPF